LNGIISVDTVVAGQLADATGDFACLVFVLLAASASPRVDQSASWQSTIWRISELSSYRYGVHMLKPCAVAGTLYPTAEEEASCGRIELSGRLRPLKVARARCAEAIT